MILYQIQDGVQLCLKFYQKKEASLLHRHLPTKARVRKAITGNRTKRAKAITSHILLPVMMTIGAGAGE
jgi:hypothetical protein